MNRFFDYFQIIGLTFFLFVFIGNTLYLRFKKNINPITLGTGKKGLQRIIEFSFFVGLIVWSIEIFLYSVRLNFQIFPAILDMQFINSIPAKFIGVIIISFGFLVFILALVSFGNSWRIGIDKETPGKLVTIGIFAFSRNPIFVFIDLYFIGTFLVNGTLIFLIFAISVVAGLHYQIIQEEKFLVTIYGEKYQDYSNRTCRYLGWQKIGVRSKG